MSATFSKNVEPSGDEVSRCVLLQHVGSTVLAERLLDQPAQPASKDY